MTQNFDAIDGRHLDIGDDDVVKGGLDFAFRHFPRGDGLDFIAFAAQRDVEHFADGALVVADEDIRHARAPLWSSQAKLPLSALAEQRWILRQPFAPAAQTCIPGQAWISPTLCLRVPARSGKQSPGLTRCHPQIATGTAQKLSRPFEDSCLGRYRRS